MTIDAPEIPSYIDLMYPTLSALESLGGTGAKDEVDKKVVELTELTQAQLDVAYPEEAQQSGSKIVHRLAFARSYLKKLNGIESVDRGQWALTERGRHFLGLDDGEAELRHREHELRVGTRPELFLKRAAQSLGNDEPVSMTTRHLLSEWDVTRRGSSVVTRIKRDLESVGLTTQPPFETTGLDAEVELVARTTPTPDESTDSADLTSVDLDEVPATVTIGTLPSASQGVTTVAPDDLLLKAQSVMESRDFSQLAVMGGPRSLKGAISWESIARAALYGDLPTSVADAMDTRAILVYEDEPLLDHVTAIADAGFVFVKDRHEVVKGIVTAADLSGEFAKLANPFLLLGEIEGWLRRIVDSVFTAEDLIGYVDPDDPDRQIEAAENLTFGEYVRLLQDPEAWRELRLAADRQVFTAHLDSVRQTRNSIMHFSPDPLSQNQLDQITSLLRWVRTLAAGVASRASRQGP